MKAIIGPSDLEFLRPQRTYRDRWTCVVPMAGNGSRFCYDRPKALFPVLGRPMVSWMVELFADRCEKFVFVVSPSGKEEIKRVAERLLPKHRLHIAVQEEARGMAAAVLVARPWVGTPNCVVVWVDQISLRSSTVDFCMRAHAREGARLTVPTVVRAAPYVHFERDGAGRIRRVLQGREERLQMAFGENDCGVFFFDTACLFHVLERGAASAIGARTGEFNLLPLLPKFEGGPGTVMTLRIAAEEETIGVNTREEARLIEALLAARKEGRTVQ